MNRKHAIKKGNPMTVIASSIFCVAFFLLGNEFAHAATLSVPSQHSTISAAANAAQSGDIIEIEASQYTGSGIVATWSDNNLTIRGVNGRARLNASGVSISNGKGVFVTTGNNITVENLEFSNASVPDENGSGIRHEGGLLTIRNCYFHDNENGLLTSNIGTSQVVIENSEFNHNGLGAPGYTHNMYIGNIAKFIIRYSYSHHAAIGHNVKTRAAENHILYNRIMDESTGNASYQIDVPNGGLTYIIGNTIHKGINAENSSLVSYAAEGRSNPIQALYVSGNTLVNDRSSATGIRIAGTPTARIVNNIFDNLNTAVSGSATVFSNNIESDNNFFFDRGNYDYHLTPDSPAINSAGNPGTGNGADLTPIYEYVHQISSKDRVDDGNLDVGAFEYATTVIGPGDVNANGSVTLEDAILALIVSAGKDPAGIASQEADVDEDEAIGLAEAIYVLLSEAGLK